MKVGARKHTTAAAGTEVLCTKRTSTATKVLLPIRLLLLSLRTSKPSKYVRHFIFVLGPPLLQCSTGHASHFLKKWAP